ncbi:MAG: RNA methyltransferase [bacterium]|nr:RNA methyltransferase [bacterium]
MALTKANLKLYRSLREAESRKESGLFLVEGPELVKEALREGWALQEAVLTHEFNAESVTGRDLRKLLTLAGVHIEMGSASDLERLSDTRTPQGIAALAKLPKIGEYSKPLKNVEVLLICESISDPGNLGALLRTADWFGVTEVILGPGSADPFNPKVVRSSAGSIFRVRVWRTADVNRVLQGEKTSGRQLFAATANGDLLPGQLPHQNPRGLVVGHEKRGVSEQVIAACTATVRIAGKGRAESLNLSVATGILLHNLCGD